MNEETAHPGELPMMTDAEIADEQAAFSAIELAALDYADAYTELQCDSDNDRQRDYRKALTEMRRVIRAEITRFSRGNRTLTCGPSCTRCGMVCNKGQNIDEQFAQKLAMELECMLLDPVGYWDKAAKVLGDYRDEWEKINPTPLSFMGEPMPAERRAIFATMKEKRETTRNAIDSEKQQERKA
jgi:hypothetical protein